MSSSGGASINPYKITEYPASTGLWSGGFNSPDGKTQVYPGPLAGETIGAFIIAGQSVSGGWVNADYTPSNSKVHNLNIYTGGMYHAADPMLGGNNGKMFGSSFGFDPNASGAWGCQLADKLINAGKYTRVILVPAWCGGASVADYASTYEDRIITADRRLKSVGITPTAVLWGQGEEDNILGTSQASCTSALNSVINSVRSSGVTCPWLIAQESYVGGTTSAAVRAAQASVVTGTIYQGPDADTLGSSYRYDGTHWNAAGADAYAALWQAAINSHL